MFVQGGLSANKLSKPMQRKLVTLVQCALTEEEGRGRAYRAARSLGERTVSELILQHQVNITPLLIQNIYLSPLLQSF